MRATAPMDGGMEHPEELAASELLDSAMPWCEARMRAFRETAHAFRMRVSPRGRTAR